MLRPGAGRTNLYSCVGPLSTETFALFLCVSRLTPIGTRRPFIAPLAESYSSPLTAERICCR
jgi:hypothetical protein